MNKYTEYINRILMETSHALELHTPKELRNVENVRDIWEIRFRAINMVSKKGMYLEFGVWKAESINFFAALINPKIIYGFDSFEGLPENWIERNSKGDFNMKGQLPMVRKNVKLIRGWFDDTLPKFIKRQKNMKAAFIHIDSDLYSSAMTIFNNIASLDLDGTIILFDEFYGYRGYKKHEYKAFKEFLDRSVYKAQYLARYKYGAQVLVRLRKKDKKE